MNAVRSVFGGGGGGDKGASAQYLADQQSLIDKQNKKAAEDKKTLQIQQNATLRSKRGRSGSRSLLTGLETGVTSTSTDTRTTLG